MYQIQEKISKFPSYDSSGFNYVKASEEFLLISLKVFTEFYNPDIQELRTWIFRTDYGK